jgi:hypothetical protein
MTPDEMDSMESITRLAAKACVAASKPYVAETDLGIHKTDEDRECEALLAGGFKSASLHPRSFIWFGKDGIRYPRPMAYALMLKQRGEHEPT